MPDKFELINEQVGWVELALIDGLSSSISASADMEL